MLIKIVLIALAITMCLGQSLKRIPQECSYNFPVTVISSKRMEILSVESCEPFKIMNTNSTVHQWFQITLLAKQDTFLSWIDLQLSYNGQIYWEDKTERGMSINAGNKYSFAMDVRLYYCPYYGFFYPTGDYTFILNLYDSYLRPNQIISSFKFKAPFGECYRPSDSSCPDQCAKVITPKTQTLPK